MKPVFQTLVVLAKKIPATENNLTWALTGGAACNAHFQDKMSNDLLRPTKDLDIISFDASFLGKELSLWEVFCAHQNSTIYLPLSEPFPKDSIGIDVWHNFHFDNTIPNIEDVTFLDFEGTRLPVLRREFLISFKMFCSFWAREKDYRDAENLARIDDVDEAYIENLLSRGPLSIYVSEKDSGTNAVSCRGKLERLGRQVFDAHSTEYLLSIFSNLPDLAGFALSLIPIGNVAKLDTDLLNQCLVQDRLNILTKSEQIFALILISANRPEITLENLLEAQDLLYGSTIKRNGLFDKNLFFTLATLWGRYMYPIFDSPFEKELKIGFQKTHMVGRFMVHCGRHFKLGSPMAEIGPRGKKEQSLYRVKDY